MTGEGGGGGLLRLLTRAIAGVFLPISRILTIIRLHRTSLIVRYSLVGAVGVWIICANAVGQAELRKAGQRREPNNE
jgi:hypothetical protein